MQQQRHHHRTALCDLPDSCLLHVFKHLCPLPDKFSVGACCWVSHSYLKTVAGTTAVLLAWTVQQQMLGHLWPLNDRCRRWACVTSMACCRVLVACRGLFGSLAHVQLKSTLLHMQAQHHAAANHIADQPLHSRPSLSSSQSLSVLPIPKLTTPPSPGLLSVLWAALHHAALLPPGQ
jgi:hypothetical protein